MYKEICECRVCKSKELELILDLGIQSLTGVFPSSVGQKVSNGPIELVRCSSKDGCGLVQLKQSYDMSEMYGLNYGYRSGLNSLMVQHLHSKVDKIIDLGILEDGDLILDIGSNDATTLRAYPLGHYKLVGIDPTGVKYSGYYPPDISLISDFFSKDAIRRSLGDVQAKIITSFSMFYDLEDPVNFAIEVESVLHNDGIWILEQSYLPSMLKTNSFDTICHEHLEFYALKQIMWIMNNAGLRVKDVEFNNINGGSFSIEVVKKKSNHASNTQRINEILKNEQLLGLEDGSAFKDFRERVVQAREVLLGFLKESKKDGKTVVGLGASTKGNVLLQYFNITSELLPVIGEINTDKFQCFTPGTLIPMASEDEVLASNPDYILVLPWHFREYFVKSKKMSGKKLVFPLPVLEIVHVD